jgi:hypothetical protein
MSARGAGQLAPAPATATARTDGDCAVEKLRGNEARAPPPQWPQEACVGVRRRFR